MTAVNTGIHELAAVRLPLQSYTGSHAVFMYSTATDGNVTLQLKEPDDLDRGSLAAMLARLQDDATFSISYQDTDILSDGSIDVLLGTGAAASAGNNVTAGDGRVEATATFDLFDSSSGPDLTLSPQTFTNSAEAFINDNSNSLGVPADSDAVAVSSSEDGKRPAVADVVKLAVKRARPKAVSPNRQGPQQCQVCAKVFGNASALAKHKLTHSDERKYICTMCGKAFKRQDHLNGHMLTHRNKKPYECKAEGCGKSYCDARSLRRHTENHHSVANGGTATTTTTASTASTTSTTMSPAQGAASGDAASPHGSSCIQYAPPPTSGNPASAATGKSQLQQLLASEPAKSGASGNNDGLTKQQLDLIHQIMEQTQRQSANALKANAKQATKPAAKTTIKVQRLWSTTNPTAKLPTVATTSTSSATQTKAAISGANGGTLNFTTSTSSSSSSTSANNLIAQANNKPSEPKPVECNLCHRKFKNIPALNGHMRLHGGYFKKDADSKKCEKKDVSGPPLQTASVSVRALIEEKIINKRITSIPSVTAGAPMLIRNEDAARSNNSSSNAPPLFPLNVHSTSAEHIDLKPFAVPTTPTQQQQQPQQQVQSIEKLIKQEPDVVNDPIKDTIKTEPDADLIPKIEQKDDSLLQFSQDVESFTLSYHHSDNTDYLSSNLQNAVFSQVPQNMLLQGMNTQQLVQFSENALDQNDQNELNTFSSTQESIAQNAAATGSSSSSAGYPSEHTVNQDLQAVLDSPLPESLAEFSAYHSNAAVVQQSTGASSSPLQSPIIAHGSPGFAYPTPPASHEGLSPCFSQNAVMPLVSPKQNQDFCSIGDEHTQPSSPLTAAFFTSTMSSSAAVEEALEEVLPGESISADELYPSLTNSPPPQPQPEDSPLPTRLTPIPSPRATTTAPIVASSSSSVHSTANFAPSTVTFPMSTAHHYTLQSQMMPNSEDPLLSSSPKDFVPRKKFDFSSLPMKVLSSNSLIDGNLTGILVESNGELKFIQTGCGGFQAKNILLTHAPVHTTSTMSVASNETHKEEGVLARNLIVQKILKAKAISMKASDNNANMFLSPAMRISRKRPRVEPLQLPVIHQSRLRATRSKPQSSIPFTPQPMLNPNRYGTGLYMDVVHQGNENETNAWCSETAPESDSTPHINVGGNFQCNIPDYIPGHNGVTQSREPEDLLWDPGITDCSDNELQMYLDLASCSIIPGGGRNQEYAMHVLQQCKGNVHEAILKLMQLSPTLASEHPLLSYQYAESDKWSTGEIETFHQALVKHNKNFQLISREIGTKSAKQCVQFYYMWKKVCTDDYKRHKQTRLRQTNELHDEKPYPDVKLLGIADSASPIVMQDQKSSYICEFPDCYAIFNSRAALNGHIRIHGGTVRNSPTPNGGCHQHPPATTATPATPSTPLEAVAKNVIYQLVGNHHSLNTHEKSVACHKTDAADEYPCKICGKVFRKIKSRSAHMKSHRPPDAEASRQKPKERPPATTATTISTAASLITTS